MTATTFYDYLLSSDLSIFFYRNADHMRIYIYIYTYIESPTPPPMIHPSLLAICSSTVLCLQMLSPRSRNHRYSQSFLHFTHADLYCDLCTPPKTQTRIWFCVRAKRKKYLSFAQLTMILGTSMVSPYLALVSFIRNPRFITRKHKKVPESPISGENSITVSVLHGLNTGGIIR